MLESPLVKGYVPTQRVDTVNLLLPLQFSQAITEYIFNLGIGYFWWDFKNYRRLVEHFKVVVLQLVVFRRPLGCRTREVCWVESSNLACRVGTLLHPFWQRFVSNGPAYQL